MKKVQILTVLFFVTGVAMAQKTAVKLNLLSPVASTFNIALERAITDKGSLQLGFYYTGRNFRSIGVKSSGFGITPEYRIYLSESLSAPAGFYVAPFVRYTSLTFTSSKNNTNNKATLTAFGGGVVVGRQWLFSERVTLDLFIGPRYLDRNLKVTAGTDVFNDALRFFGGFGVRAGMTLGIAF